MFTNYCLDNITPSEDEIFLANPEDAEANRVKQGLLNIGHDVKDCCENLQRFFEKRYHGNLSKAKIKA